MSWGEAGGAGEGHVPSLVVLLSVVWQACRLASLGLPRLVLLIFAHLLTALVTAHSTPPGNIVANKYYVSLPSDPSRRRPVLPLPPILHLSSLRGSHPSLPLPSPQSPSSPSISHLPSLSASRSPITACPILSQCQCQGRVGHRVAVFERPYFCMNGKRKVEEMNK